MKAYKGFDKNLKCRNFQYEVGREYKTDCAELCAHGFHACKAPLKVWDFYPPIDGNRFCEVVQSGSVKNDGVEGKSVSTKIKIVAETGIPGLVKAHVEWCKKHTKAATKSSDAASGESTNIGSSDDSALISSSGDSARIGSIGDFVKISSNGHFAKIGSSGSFTKIGSSGNHVQIGSSGGYVQIGSSGNSAQIGSYGDSAQIGSSGDNAKISSSGDNAKISSSGDSAQISSSGDNAQIGSSGDNAQIKCDGKNSVVACVGKESAVNAPIGTWVCLSEYGFVGGESVCVGMKAFRVDGKKYKANTWYALKYGKVVEVKVV